MTTAESIVRWFVVREKHYWMTTDYADKSKRARFSVGCDCDLFVRPGG
jgi:hypothetical protein